MPRLVADDNDASRVSGEMCGSSSSYSAPAAPHAPMGTRTRPAEHMQPGKGFFDMHSKVQIHLDLTPFWERPYMVGENGVCGDQAPAIARMVAEYQIGCPRISNFPWGPRRGHKRRAELCVNTSKLPMI